MTDTNTQTGKCLCGAVQILAASPKDHFDAWHCSMCRKWGGGPFFAVECGADVEFRGSENITTFASSEWAERGFCKSCGTHLFYRLRETNQYEVPAGLFNSTQHWDFHQQIFIDEKPEYYSFANATRNLTGAELFAQFGADAE